MADQQGLTPSPELWSVFEAEAMPHVNRLFRLAMWMERYRQEAEDLVQVATTAIASPANGVAIVPG